MPYVCVLQYQQTPMHKAVWSGKVEIIKMLKDNGAAVDAKDMVS